MKCYNSQCTGGSGYRTREPWYVYWRGPEGNLLQLVALAQEVWALAPRLYELRELPNAATVMFVNL
jgi:hypothetical protein